MLSRKTKYALNALIHLARKLDQGPILISQISEEEQIPKKFLEAILLDLRKAGILNSKKGKGGGYYLIKNPEEVDLATIVRLFDGAIALLPCVSENYYEPCEECKDESFCGLRSVMQEVRDATVQMLQDTTLADILRREDRLRIFPHPPS